MILIVAINAKYVHASLGARYLLANLQRGQAELLEHVIHTAPETIVESIVRRRPRLVGFGVYVWNTTIVRQVIQLLRTVAPEIRIVLGGPEVSHETGTSPLLPYADAIITGEADLAFASVCQSLLEDAPEKSACRIVHASPPELSQLKLPYSLYSDDDLAHRLVYVEASRGCPFHCDFCLSSLDDGVRAFDLELFQSEIAQLLERGVRKLKFVDRTFNLKPGICTRILDFLLPYAEKGAFFHFEIVPDRLASELLPLAKRFPAGTLQFEVGIQTFNPEVAARIHRRQDFAKTRETLSRLAAETQVQVHADLIAGLPGEDLESFGRGFDELLSYRPAEIQVGILKRLRGAPIAQHDQVFQMKYSPEPPYEVLQTSTLDFVTLQRIKRLARYWELFYNSGEFRESLPMLWRESSAFREFLAFSDWLYAETGKTHQFPLETLAKLLLTYLLKHQAAERRPMSQELFAGLERDYFRTPGRKRPAFLLR